MAQPILREAVEGREDLIEEDEARLILERCMTVLWYRDARSSDQIQVGRVTRSGVSISAPYEISQNWDVAHYQFN